LRIPTLKKLESKSHRSRSQLRTASFRELASSVHVEGLEYRILWSVSENANGWTVVTPSANSVVYYVSSSTGNDSNTGLSAATPFATIAKAESKMVSGQPDEILLKCGDTFYGSFVNWIYSGQSASAPMLVSNYGTGSLPLVYSGSASAGFATPINQPSNNAAVNYLDVIGIRFDPQYHDPTLATFNLSGGGGTTGFFFENPGSNILVEDCSFTYYRYNVDIEAVEGPISNITFRRDVDDDAYCENGGHSQGLYAEDVSGITIDQCTFDRDGWDPAIYQDGAADLGFNHDMYIASTCSNVTIQENVIAEASYAGIMARAGGNIDNNIFIDDAVACAFGSADGALSAVGGVTGSLIGNTVVGDRASQTITYNSTSKAWVLGSGLAFGQGFVIADTAPNGGVIVADNIFTQDSQNAKPAIQLEVPTGTYNPASNVGINDLTIEDNILNGWRVGIQTSGNFVPGGTGLYALNGLTVTGNTIINSSTQEVRHDGAFSSAQETWTADRFYDTVLGQAGWITLQGTNLPFSTWATSYDIGATALAALNYTNRFVSVASYDLTLGGPGTWQDFVAQSDMLSINDYRPQYMAMDAVTYIQQGFDIASTFTNGTADTPPTAVATTTNLNAAATGTTYSFTVTYTDGALLSTASLGNGNLLVDGPNGYSQYATYMSAATPTVDSSGYQHTVVTYQINAPLGVAWGIADNGTYTIDLLPNEITDSLGNVAPDAVIGSFSVDFTLPTAIATVSNLSSSAAGTTSYGFTVTYADSAGIDTTTLGSYQVRVTGPNSYSKYATLTGDTTTSSGSVVATYSIAAPGGSWTTAANGTYTVTLASGSVYDLAGNAAAGGTLATFTVNLSSSSNASTGTASITGTVFNDANADGVYDNRENTLNGVEIFIDLAGTGVYSSTDPSAVTNSSGAYTISNLLAGTYTLLEIAPAGFAVTTPTSASNVVTVTTGATATGVNFANQVSTSVVSGSGGSTTTGTSNTSGGTTTTTGSGTGKTTTGTTTTTGSGTGKTTTGTTTTTGSGTGKTTTGSTGTTTKGSTGGGSTKKTIIPIITNKGPTNPLQKIGR
jgi:hypothetical protein